MPKAQAPLARPPIDPEELAAFIDGRLEGERRRLMIERLAEDEDAYDLYDEVIRVRAELADFEGVEPAAAEPPREATPERHGTGRDRVGAAPVVRLPRRNRRPWFGWPGLGWAAAAAALVAVVLAGGWLLIRPRGPVPSSELLARYDPDNLGTGAAAVALEVLRPPFRGKELTPEEREVLFQLGVRAFDLALAVEAEDRERAKSWLREIERLLRSEALLLPYPHQTDYRDIAARLVAGASLSSLRSEIADAEADLEDYLDLPDEPYFAFGRWVEAMRVAAATGDRRFLASRQARRPLRLFMKLEPSPLVAGHLTAVSTELDRGVDAADLETIEQATLAIITECARGSACLGAGDAN